MAETPSYFQATDRCDSCGHKKAEHKQHRDAKPPHCPDPPDPIKQLGALLSAAGARVTFDSGRSIQHPCTFCGTVPDAGRTHELYTIGFYPNGQTLTRPVCGKEHCRKIAGLWQTQAEEAQQRLKTSKEPA